MIFSACRTAKLKQEILGHSMMPNMKQNCSNREITIRKNPLDVCVITIAKPQSKVKYLKNFHPLRLLFLFPPQALVRKKNELSFGLMIPYGVVIYIQAFIFLRQRNMKRVLIGKNVTCFSAKFLSFSLLLSSEDVASENSSRKCFSRKLLCIFPFLAYVQIEGRDNCF